MWVTIDGVVGASIELDPGTSVPALAWQMKPPHCFGSGAPPVADVVTEIDWLGTRARAVGTHDTASERPPAKSRWQVPQLGYFLATSTGTSPRVPVFPGQTPVPYE